MLDAAQAGLVAGTPHEHRYIVAGDSVAMDLVFLGPESGRPRSPLSDAQIVEALGVLSGRWTG